MFLTGIGLCGVLKYSIQMRQFELGTRMAIGAKRIISLIIKDNGWIILLGILTSTLIMLVLYITFTEYLKSYLVNTGNGNNFQSIIEIDRGYLTKKVLISKCD